MTTRLEGKPVAATIEAEVRSAIGSGAPGGRGPVLASLHRALDTPFRFYVRRQAKAAAALGIGFREETVDPAGGPAALARRLSELDQDPGVDGILVEHPLPPPFDFFSALDGVSPEKDIDGVSSRSLGRLVQRQPLHVPAVARAAFAIARHYHLPLDGEPVAVLGRSPTVGLPLGVLLAAPPPGGNATVTLVHSRTRDLRKALEGTRTVFSCVGHPGLLRRESVPEGVHVIDVGLTSVPDPTRPGGSRAAGDADAASLEGWAASLTPVPGGVGPVTVAELMANTVRAWQLLGRGVRPRP